MTLTVRNLSPDLKARIRVGSRLPEFIDPMADARISIDGDSMILSVYYDREFRFGIKPPPPARNLREAVIGRGTEKIIKGIGNAVLKTQNTYMITGIKDGAVIEVRDRAYYSDPSEAESFFKCIPALILCGIAESDDADISVTQSIPMNRSGFLTLYRLVFRLANLRGVLFNIFRYSAQIGRQKRISKERRLTKTFRKLYGMTRDERDRRLSPVAVLAEKAVSVIRERLTGRLIFAVIERIGKAALPEKIDKIK